MKSQILYELTPITEQRASSLEQTNSYMEQPNTEESVTFNSHQFPFNFTSLPRSSIINIVAPAIATDLVELVPVADQPANNSPEAQIQPHNQECDTEAEVTSVSQPSDLSETSEAVTEKPNLTAPQYSQNASDLQLQGRSANLSNPAVANEISQTVTERSPQSENPRLVQNQEPKSGEAKTEPEPDKSQYNLFNPTPRNQWRDFSTDRPDKTETPFTVDAGRFTMEADLFVYTRDTNSPDGTRTESFNFFVPNFKVGLTNNVDLQIIPEVYNIVRTTPKGGRTEERSGFGDVTVRVKVNFWGNDGGQTALGLMPFIKLPTNQNNIGNNSVEGGVIVPFAVKLSETWDVGMQTEFDFNKNQDASGYNLGFVNTVSFGHELSDRWSTYFELFTQQTTERGSQFVATFDTGLKYLLTENIQLDAGVNIGLTQAADDIQPFMGVSVRF